MAGRITAAIVFVGITAVIIFVFTTGAIAAPMSTFWTRALDSRPEADRDRRRAAAARLGAPPEPSERPPRGERLKGDTIFFVFNNGSKCTFCVPDMT